MSHKFSAMLSLATFLDSTCYSEDFYLFSHRPRVPFAFDSDDYVVDMGGTPDPTCSVLVSSTMADTPQAEPQADPQAEPLSMSSSSEESTSSTSPAAEGTRAACLPRLAFRKPPRPALPPSAQCHCLHQTGEILSVHSSGAHSADTECRPFVPDSYGGD